eukprot:4069572-Heterocapsa_arctica.AAC.1
MGALQRVARQDELVNLTPAINSEIQASIISISSSQALPNPPPVPADQNFPVEAYKLKCGVYDRTCLNTQKDASGTYEYPTNVDHSVINDFLSDDHSKLATYRKGLRWALMSST